MLRHLLCIVALMWSPLVNGQPFLFPDTTSYVRAADLVAYKLSGGRVHTVWTDVRKGSRRRRRATREQRECVGRRPPRPAVRLS